MESNNLMVFEGHNVEVFEWEGKVLFNAKHVAECLGIKNVNDNISKMNEKQVIKLTNSKIGETDFRKLHNTGENSLTESGVYKLIFKSHKDEAEKFQDWVTDDVLPSIRKHGLYAKDELLQNPDLFISVLQDLKAERERTKKLNLEVAQNNQIIKELQPKASYYDTILQSTSLVPITKIAKDYGMSGKSFNNTLRRLGVQYKMGDTWLLHQKYASNGYTQSKTYAVNENKTVMHTYWTQKGRLFLYDLLKNSENILPTIEKEMEG